MSWKKIVKSIHLASTIWFVLCIGYIFILSLRQAGFNWWIIFSLSGHSALIVFLLVSLYLFAIFRGFDGRSQAMIIEHPLSCTSYYLMFYVMTPALAGLTSSLAMIDENRINLFISGVVLGTLATTFAVWIVIDPIILSLELLLPQNRKNRANRLAQIKAESEKRQKDHELLLAQILDQEKENIKQWQEALRPKADQLAALLITSAADFKQAEIEAVEIGAGVWQMGGLTCMQTLREMAIAIYKQKNQNRDFVDYISVWWDGIGSWRNTALF